MTEPGPDVDRRDVQLPDGRRLIYYGFPEAPERDGSAPAPPEKEEPPPGEGG